MKLQKTLPPNGIPFNATERASFGGLHVAGYVAASAAEFLLIQKQRQTAKEYFDLAKRDFDFWKAKYQDKEVDFKNEAFAIPEVLPNYSENLGAEVFGLPPILKQTQSALDKLPPWHIGRRWRIDFESRKQQMLIRATGYVGAYRVNYAYAERENIRRIARRASAVNVGLQAGNEAMAGFGQATASSVNSMRQVQNSFRALRSGFGQAIGFNRRMREEST
jgi:cell division septum initiation protein DivIVA